MAGRHVHPLLRRRAPPGPCTEAGLEPDLVRPRTVLSPSMVTRMLHRDPKAMARLVQAELTAEADESVGIQLVVMARKPA